MFEERVSAKTANRHELKAMLEYIREGDTVVVHDISRLARNIRDLHDLVEQITAKGVAPKFQKEGLVFTGDKSDAMSQLLLSMLGVFMSLRELSCLRDSVRVLHWQRLRESLLGGKLRLTLKRF